MKIGQLANIVGCTVEAVRFYEKQGLIEPAKRTSGNFRVYTEEHLKQLSFICYCRSLDISRICRSSNSLISLSCSCVAH